MLVRSLLLLVFVVFVLSCDCSGTTLTHVCPYPTACIVDQDEIIVEGLDSIVHVGVCRPGVTQCGDDNIINACVGFVGPSNETCDQLDNDCDGSIDEDFDEDKDGYTICENDCDDRDKTINPGSNEICNNIDDDCDGIIDGNVIDCWTGSTVRSFESPAICRKGTTTCNVGVWSTCMGQVNPTVELCDDLDNDCDGAVDERIQNVCGWNNTGACHLGDLVCVDGDDQVCVGSVFPSNEACNNVDDDCDGSVDEGLQRSCQTACGVGIETCAAGTWMGCTAPVPEPETCDRLDNDCDGQSDEDCSCVTGDVQPCRSNVIDRVTGVVVDCGLGVTVCTPEGNWGTCNLYQTEPERCDNWDNDCDGMVDGFSETCGDAVTAGVGQCMLGQRSCDAGIWTDCVGVVNPESEICNAIDDDCDGSIDENLNPHDNVDICIFIDGSASMCGVMHALTAGISAYVSDFVNTNHRFCLGVFPGNSGPVDMLTGTSSQALVGIIQMQNALAAMNCIYASIEPSYDAAAMAMSSSDPLGIGWRSDAYPYVVIVTDETAQSWVNRLESSVASLSQACDVGTCEFGDRYEAYVMTLPPFFIQWDAVVFNEPDRLIDLNPADPIRYTSILRDVFSNVCF